MKRKPKFTKDIKIKACEDYRSGNGSYQSIAEDIGVALQSVRQWYLYYERHGESAFEMAETNKSYSREFKQMVIDEYLSGKHVFDVLSAKYLISTNVLRSWVKKSYNGIELKDYDPKGEVYTMKSRKTTFEERLEIVKWVIANDMNYKEAANKFANNYANIYKWTKTYMTDGVDALKDRKRGPKNKNYITEDSLSEIDKLKMELERERTLRKRREFELEVLKKKEEFENQSRYRK